ncbi:methyltransferase domain-containing protein [Dactylosporangium sp. NPDC051484]|uniref:methyltransferase domain-containing protein n=1 Tax=Dactylosporangium sp. NPDC051484 TaxID=3154942 RepID=UPI00344B7EF9
MDGQDRPDDWVRVLDVLDAEPFYASYKARLRELLAPAAPGRCLDVGAGTGANAARLADEHGIEMVVVDHAHTMARAAQSRGLTRVAVADAARLPFAAATFAGAMADRVLQHLADPRAAVAEMVRVTVPGGRIVLADPDYDTQVLDIEDQDVARAVLRFRADHALRNGTLAHRHAGILATLGMTDVVVETRTLVVRDPNAVDHVMGLRTWAATAAKRGLLEPARAAVFEVEVDRAIRAGRFLYAVTFFLTSAVKPS